MKKTRHTTEQIIRIPREAEGSQMKAEKICRKHSISPQTYYRWKSKYGGMDLKATQRLRELERENGELKKLLADQLPYTLSESRVVFEDWRRYYNGERPHRSLDLQTPEEFAKKTATKVQPAVGLRPPSGRTLGRESRAKTNRNQRKLSHLLWAKSRGPTNA